jgi:hypothetical protein
VFQWEQKSSTFDGGLKGSCLRPNGSTGSMSAQVDDCLLGLKAEKHLDRERALRRFQELISQSGELSMTPA